jgi:hypothetical protein
VDDYFAECDDCGQKWTENELADAGDEHGDGKLHCPNCGEEMTEF